MTEHDEDIPQYVTIEVRRLRRLYIMKPSKKIEDKLKKIYLRELNERMKQ